MVKPLISGQPDRFGLGSIKLGLVCLASILIKFFWFKDVFDKHTFRPILATSFKKKMIFFLSNIPQINFQKF
jgi:hypothetical protein